MSTVKVNTVDKRTGSTLTLGGCGTTVTLGAGATQSGFGRTGTVDWCTTAKTAPFTGVSGKGYFVNTTCGAVTVTLPATPTAGDIISIKDYAGTWQTNNLTICRNGSKIAGGCNVNPSLESKNESVTLIYVDATQGWLPTSDTTSDISSAELFITATGGTVVTCGNYKTHIFTSSGCFSVSALSNNAAYNKMDYLVVAGGGGSGTSCASGGGGAGGFRVSNCLALPAPSMSPLVAACGAISATIQTYPITVGGGGSGSTFSGTGAIPAPGSIGTDGSPSIFSTITSTGGGRGGGSPCGSVKPGQPGGSGGGGSHSLGTGGTGNTPPVSPPQGNNGSASAPATVTGDDEGGGAGGAAAGGGPAVGGIPAGGIGSYISDGFINPTCAPSYGTPGPVASTRYFSGGGGGAIRNQPNVTPTAPYITQAAGGYGGGGRGGVGGPATDISGVAGTVNTGGGAGGSTKCAPSSSYAAGVAGGSGIIMIRYRYQ